jgi:ADP-ribose pyrophosphatase
MIKKITNVKRDTKFKGFFQLDSVQYQFSKYQGGTSELVTREMFIRGDAVIAFLYDSEHQKIILVEQCRTGAIDFKQTNNEQAWLLEPVAGMIDAGENQLDACIREAEEEAGVKHAKFEFVCHYYPSPAACEEVLHMYAADIDYRKLPQYAGLDNEAEDIRIVSLDYADAKQKLRNGYFNVASTIIALQWLFLKDMEN